MCVKCLTPNKPPAPDQHAQRGEGCRVKVIVTSFLAESWYKKITVSEVFEQFGGGGEKNKSLGAKNVPSSSRFQVNTFMKVAARWDGAGL